MKYHTLGSSNVANEGRKATFTIYADMDISQTKMAYTEDDMKTVREELENVQKALTLQTKRCRQLVSEYTRKLQKKEQLYQNEKMLRDTQLAKVLKALLIFEARLKQEQKFITHQLNEKDYIIKTQSNEIKKLLASQYCKNCNQYYSTSPATLESFNSSSEYGATEHDYQSSNFESLDSSSETYATLSERGYPKSENEEEIKEKNVFQKHKNNEQGPKKNNPYRKNVATYFEVLKLRNDTPLSNEDNTSADYDNLESLPPESVSDKISVVSENIKNIFNRVSQTKSTASESSLNVTSSECGKTVINTKLELNPNITRVHENDKEKIISTESDNRETKREYTENKLTETIPVFEGNGDSNDNWYASASDQEDEEQRDVYRNNPVLECMNQILLQNINDINSPPKTPNIERKTNNKRVKFSDEEVTNVEVERADSQQDYYETPIQKTPNFYETPQSIYSNDYEQILSKCNESFTETTKPEIVPRKNIDSKSSSNYIEMENVPDKEGPDGTTNGIVRKSKILRTPPALPPKPPNLVSKYKIQSIPKQQPPSENGSSVDLEPDYCSISELNLPQGKNVSVKKISVVADVHSPTSLDVINKMNVPLPAERHAKKIDDVNSKTIQKEDNNAPNLLVKKCVENLNIQLAKHTSVRPETIVHHSPKKKIEIEIPKLPQVSEIIIPDDPEEKENERIAQDNYIKNNTQVLKSKKPSDHRRPIVMGSTVSSLISSFNNHQILNEIKKKHERPKSDSIKVFSSFDNLQDLDKQHRHTNEKSPDVSSFQNFDLSQNFEEFKLDDCEIEEYDVEQELNREDTAQSDEKHSGNFKILEKPPPKPERKNPSNRVDLIRAIKDKPSVNLEPSSIELLKNQLKLQKIQNAQKKSNKESSKNCNAEPTYEHFLECTGLSSKSIMTTSRLLSNHKHMLKPKDVKLRSKSKVSSGIFEKSNGKTVKYWSEPFV
ncbi:uncharacterized protein LOC115885532 [Sitophilus oryzae]|uniref:Uncharacterized protein LOC115885532 n=1 Tax=Sitophilus oryzae TaxID=7048 RepID=A0A6J2YAT6_SITOR|nr:uncharacterized protein LOC115885532 [Sitophilus oryzae]